MKVYYGTNTGPGPQIIWALPAPGANPYRLRHHVRHSPDGFQWGGGGSGPSEAARCILLDCCSAGDAEAFYQRFKIEFIATAGRLLSIPEAAIHEWLEKIKKE